MKIQILYTPEEARRILRENFNHAQRKELNRLAKIFLKELKKCGDSRNSER